MFGWLKKRPDGPDFSAVDSQAKAEELFQRGALERLVLLPPEFGGEDAPDNILYVPLGIADIKAGIDKNVIVPLAAERKITRYKAVPQYQGQSRIPIAIQIAASDSPGARHHDPHLGRGPGQRPVGRTNALDCRLSHPPAAEGARASRRRGGGLRGRWDGAAVLSGPPLIGGIPQFSSRGVTDTEIAPGHGPGRPARRRHS